jgi:hypothetical protein
MEIQIKKIQQSITIQVHKHTHTHSHKHITH